MSREIKFRAWDIDRKTYRGSSGKITDYPEILFVRQSKIKKIIYKLAESFRHKIVLEQYTGLKDKNGKEIYEGDIVDDGYSRICKIRWSEHFTAFEAVNENDGYMSNIWFVAKYGKVIGNIHDNPEVLGGKE